MNTDLDFTVDFLIIAEAMEVLLHVLGRLSTESEPLGLKVSWINTNTQDLLPSSTRA